jgi:hypothetical protein
MPQFLDGGEVPAGSAPVHVWDATSAFCTMTDLYRARWEAIIAALIASARHGVPMRDV